MKVEDFKTVSQLLDVRRSVQLAMKDCLAIVESDMNIAYLEEVHPLLRQQMSCHISMYGDGSGDSLFLDRCYIKSDLYRATLDILKQKLGDIDEALVELGVEL